MSDIAALLERVRAATGPNWQIDRAISIELDEMVANYTASVDAALALVERKLPGWVVADLSQNSRHAGDPWGCQLACYFGSDPSRTRSVTSGHNYPQPALAIIAALLQALKDSSHE